MIIICMASHPGGESLLVSLCLFPSEPFTPHSPSFGENGTSGSTLTFYVTLCMWLTFASCCHEPDTHLQMSWFLASTYISQWLKVQSFSSFLEHIIQVINQSSIYSWGAASVSLFLLHWCADSRLCCCVWLWTHHTSESKDLKAT